MAEHTFFKKVRKKEKIEPVLEIKYYATFAEWKCRSDNYGLAKFQIVNELPPIASSTI